MRPIDTKKTKYIEVVGAGYVALDLSPNSSCGGKEGFGFGVSWSKHAYIGGVLPREEARALARAILKELSDPNEW